MADNTDEEHLENPTTNQSENLPDEIISHNDSDTITPNQESENMEAHHHSHSHRKKNWKSYIWEFLMLFLAVFCGFLAEYQLEHTIEKDRAAELAKSFYAELKWDSASVQKSTEAALKKDTAIQYLKRYFTDSSVTHVSKEFAINYNLALLINRSVIFEPRVAMLDLLVNSGSLRYFKNKELQQLTIDLSNTIKIIQARNERANQYIVNNIDPFVIKTNDDKWQDTVRQLKEGFKTYRTTSISIPFHLYNPEKIDKIEDVNRIGIFSSIIRTNAQIYYKAYDSLNFKLLSELRKEYKLD